MGSERRKKKRLPLAASAVVGIGSVIVVLLRVGYPHHGWLGLGIYAVGCGLLVIALKRSRTLRATAREAAGFFERHGQWLIAGAGMLLVGAVLLVLFPVQDRPFHELDAQALDVMLSRDLGSVDRLVVAHQRALSPGGDGDVLDQRAFTELAAAEQQQVLGFWAAFVDRTVAAERLTVRHRHFYQIDPVRHREHNVRSFLIGYAALLANVRAGLTLRQRVRNNPTLTTALNDPRPEHGIPRQAYSRIERGLAAPEIGILVNAGRVHLSVARRTTQLDSPEEQRLVEFCRESYEQIAKTLGKQPHLALESALRVYQDTTLEVWFPLQKGVSEAMGDIRTTGRKNLVTAEQAHQARTQLEPGDIVLERRNWYLSNVGLPGFWPHAALYTGDLTELDRYFAGAAALGGRTASEVIAERFPEVHERYQHRNAAGHAPSMLEAVSEGVVLHQFEESAAADYVAVLRPKLGREDKLGALLQAYEYLGRPYDFDFDFVTDASLVCSEVVYKAYRATEGRAGLNFELGMTAGRQVVSPTDMAQKFDREYGTPAEQLAFVLFLDGVEADRTAISRDVAAFRESVHRPKWDFLQQ